MGTFNAQFYLKKYQDELYNSVIPFWEQHSIDHEYGGYFTFLDRDGSIYDTQKYMWMQWRNVYMFASLAKEHPAESQWFDYAKQGYDFLVKNGKNEEGKYYFALNQQGEPIIAPYNIYSQAFATMGAAAMYDTTQEMQYKDEALANMEIYLETLTNPKGQWNKSLKANQQWQEHGHYMILANLGRVLEDCVQCSLYSSEIDKAVRKVLSKFWNPDMQILFENITPQDEIDLNSCAGRHINPGHGLESMWFMLEYAERTGSQAIITEAVHIIKSLLRFGWDAEFGGLFYFMDAMNKPHLELQWDMKLWWVHCEAILAILYGYKLTQDPELLKWFGLVNDWTWNHFPDPEYGEWFGYLNRQGKPTHMLKGGKWKTFFHLPRFLRKGIELLSAISDEKKESNSLF